MILKHTNTDVYITCAKPQKKYQKNRKEFAVCPHKKSCVHTIYCRLGSACVKSSLALSSMKR